MFTLSPSTDTTGVTTMGEVEVPPAMIVQRFGPPSPSDEYKVSGQYVFVNQAGEPFVVHDWKATSLWDERFPTPETFWASREPEELCIATRDLDTGEFERWFLKQLGLEFSAIEAVEIAARRRREMHIRRRDPRLAQRQSHENACQNCGSVYWLEKKSFPCVNKGLLHCDSCDHVLLEWWDFETWEKRLIGQRK
jgi:hypothetical protein